MKLMYCPHCKDIRKIHEKKTECLCGKSYSYMTDSLHVEIKEGAVLLETCVNEFSDLLANTGYAFFTSFIPGEPSVYIKRITDEMERSDKELIFSKEVCEQYFARYFDRFQSHMNVSSCTKVELVKKMMDTLIPNGARISLRLAKTLVEDIQANSLSDFQMHYQIAEGSTNVQECPSYKKLANAILVDRLVLNL